MAARNRRDITWENYFNQLMACKRSNNSFEIPSCLRNSAKLKRWVNKQRANHNAGKLSKERFEKLNNAGFQWDPLEELWQSRFEALVAFKEQEGHLNVPKAYKKEPSLHGWLLVQRREQSAGKLLSKRQTALEKIGVSFSQKDPWEEKFQDLKNISIENGYVPELGPEYKELKNWIMHQRAAHRRKTLSEKKVQLLTEIGLEWNPKDKASAKRMAILTEYFNQHGHCNIPEADPDFGKEGAWLTAIRMRYRKGTLEKSLISKLECLNISWEPRSDRYQEMLKRLRLFKEEHGHSDPISRDTNDSSLIIWLNRQRSLYHSGVLQKERIAELEALGIVWEEIRKRRGSTSSCRNPWNERYELLKIYRESHGHINVPSTDKPLGKWLSKQRVYKREGFLPQQCIDLLDALGVVWAPLQEQLDKHKSVLKEFFTKHGHCNIAETHPTLGKHGDWLSSQRRKYFRSKLDKELIEFLEKLNVSWKPREESWECNYEKLKAIKKEDGSAKAWADESLRHWLSVQRALRREGKLDSDRVNLLTELGIEWEPAQAIVEKHLNELRKFFTEAGHCNIPYDSQTGSWLSDVIRKKYKQGELEQDLKAELESMNICWDAHEAMLLRGIEWKERICTQCGKTFTPTHGQGRVCSATCYLKSSIEVDASTGCHNWKGSLDTSGRPHAVWQGKRRKGHVFAYELAGGVLPLGKVLRHICNNSRCCNPEHLILGTNEENVKDRIKAGTSAGEKNWNSVLTNKQAIEIYQLKSTKPKPSTKSLAEKYGVPRYIIQNIWSGKTYSFATNAERIVGRPLGSRNPSVRYSEEIVLKAYSLKGSMSAAAAARKLKVPDSLVRSIWCGKTWSHLTGEKPKQKNSVKENTKCCVNCGKTFRLKKGTRLQYCSIECSLNQQIRHAGDDECHLWTGGKAGKYGVVRHRGQQRMAHILAFDLANPNLVSKREEEHLTVSHECHNSLCCNPNHLTLRSREENSSLNAGRKDLIGENAVGAKITDEIANRIIYLLEKQLTNKVIREKIKNEFGIDAYYQIIDIKRGRAWRHLRR